MMGGKGKKQSCPLKKNYVHYFYYLPFIYFFSLKKKIISFSISPFMEDGLIQSISNNPVPTKPASSPQQEAGILRGGALKRKYVIAIFL